MLLRRLGLGLAVLVLVTVVIAAVVARVEDGDRARAPKPSRSSTPARDVAGELPQDQTVRATVGDIVSITVDTPQDDTVAIEQLGEEVDTAPDVPGVLRFVTYAPGTFPIVSEMTDRTLGRLVVAPARG